MPPAKRQYSNKHEFKGRLQKIKQSLKFQQKAKQTFQKRPYSIHIFYHTDKIPARQKGRCGTVLSEMPRRSKQNAPTFQPKHAEIRLKRRGVFRKLRKGLLAQLAGTLAQVSSMMPFTVFFDGKAGAPHRFHHQNVSDYGHYRG